MTTKKVRTLVGRYCVAYERADNWWTIIDCEHERVIATLESHGGPATETNRVVRYPLSIPIHVERSLDAHELIKRCLKLPIIP